MNGTVCWDDEDSDPVNVVDEEDLLEGADLGTADMGFPDGALCASFWKSVGRAASPVKRLVGGKDGTTCSSITVVARCSKEV